MTFARTKIQTPRPRGGTQIERPALEARLAAAFAEARLVVVAAPAGFGKTTALARAAARLPADHAFGWIACDAEDGPLELLECLLAVLEPLDPPWRVAPEALLRLAAEATDEARLRALAADVINAVDACAVAHGTVVVDDLHRIGHPQVFAFLDALVARLSPRWTLVVASRTEPPLALARLRVAGDLAEFRADDLRFEPAEVRRLAAASGLDDDAAERLLARTEGWPAGLRLALASPAAGAIDRHVFDYLTSEVIDRLPADEREFLFLTSVLPELTPPRAAAVSGDAAAAARLDAIARAGLFVTVLDDQGPTLRLHDLFRDVLETRFARERPAAWREALHRAAATEPDPLRRVAWLQRAEAWDAAEDVLVEVAEEQVAAGGAAAVRRLFDAFPAPRREHSARLKLLVARAAWDWDTAVEATAGAAAALAAEGRGAEQLRALSYHALALSGACRTAPLWPLAERLLAEPALEPAARARTLAALGWATVSRGDQRGVAALAGATLDALEPAGTLAHWLECTPLGPHVGLPGMRAPLERFISGALQRVPDRPAPLRGVVMVLQGWLALWRGDVPAAEAAAAAALSEARWLARPIMLDAPTRTLHATLRALRGDHGALDALVALADEIDRSGVPLRAEAYAPLYLHHAMRIAALLGDAPVLAAMATRLLAVPEGSRSWLSPAMRRSAPAHLAWQAGDRDGAIGHWRALLADEWHSDVFGQVADTRLRLADALLPRQRRDAAEVLAPLFARIDDDGDVGGVLLAGPLLLARLAAADWGDALAPARRQALQRWAAQAQALRAEADAGGVPAPAPADGLSAREREVLERIAAGDSNKLIARALDLSPHTVKRHVANILDKLGLQSRAQAAAWLQGQRP